MTRNYFSYKSTFKNLIKSFKLIWHYQRSYLIIKLLSTLITPTLSYMVLLLSKEALNILELENENKVILLIFVVLVTFLLSVLSLFADRAFQLFDESLSNNLSEIIRTRFYKKLVSQTPLSDLEHPSFYSNVQSMNKMGIWSIIGSVSIPFALLTSIVYLIIAVVTAIQYQSYIIFLYVLIFPFTFILEILAKRRSIYVFDKAHNIQRKAGVVKKLLRNKDVIYDIKTTQSIDWFIKKNRQLENDSFLFSEKESLKQSSLIQLRDSLNLVFKYGLMLFLLYKVLIGQINIGDYTLIIGIATNFMACLRNAVVEIGMIRENLFYMNQLFDFLDNQPIKKDYHNDSTSSLIKLDNISFSYPGSQKSQVQNLDLEIRKGEKIMIVGYNGAGKTTLSKIILGLYRPCEGAIYYNGIDYLNMDDLSLFAHFSVAFQNHIKYPVSLKNNIILGKEDEAVYADVLKKSDLEDKVKNLPKGDETILNKELFSDGTDLSGGEWNKVVLARALYHQKDVILFDEPLASLDIFAEEHFIKTLLDQYSDKTIIIVSHRLSCAKMVDRIIFMENGKIKEQGSHEFLLKQNGSYSDFYHAQIENISMPEIAQEKEAY